MSRSSYVPLCISNSLLDYKKYKTILTHSYAKTNLYRIKKKKKKTRDTFYDVHRQKTAWLAALYHTFTHSLLPNAQKKILKTLYSFVFWRVLILKKEMMGTSLKLPWVPQILISLYIWQRICAA